MLGHIVTQVLQALAKGSNVETEILASRIVRHMKGVKKSEEREKSLV